MYLRAVSKFDEWLQGRSFPSSKMVTLGKKKVKQDTTESFASVEKLLKHCDEPDYDSKTVQRALREYMVSPGVAAVSAGMQAITRSAIKSYFDASYVVLTFPKTKKHSEPVLDDCR